MFTKSATFASVLALCLAGMAHAQSPVPPASDTPGTATIADAWKGFEAPARQEWPRTWFHVINGNMSREGITKDMEAMRAAGISGAIMFFIDQRFTAYGDIKYLSAEHLALVGHASAEAKRLGLTFGFHNSSGWSSSGGPQVAVEDSMKIVTSSDMVVDGGAIDLALAEPASRYGFYKDVAVLAWPSLAAEVEDAALRPVLAASDDGAVDTFTDKDEMSGRVINAAKSGDQPWLDIRYDRPVTVRSLTASLDGVREVTFRILGSQDGKTFNVIADKVAVPRLSKAEWGINETFAPQTVRAVRIEASAPFKVMTVRASTLPIPESFYGVTGRSGDKGAALPPVADPGPGMVIDSGKIRDLTASFANGRLRTTLPRGKWTIMRVGYTSLGTLNSPATPEATGLEVDKFDAAAVDRFYAAVVEPKVQAVRAADGRIDDITIDSYEQGPQNWTGGYLDTFRAAMGYDLTRFLPIFAGRYVDSAARTEAVAFDLRGLNARLMQDNYYGQFRRHLARDGIKLITEPYGFGNIVGVDVGGKGDISMGEFWLNRDSRKVADPASAAFAYGQDLVSTEAFTGQRGLNWGFYPGLAKKDGDDMWSRGVNEFVFHRFTHQSNVHAAPGMTMGYWGSHVDRTQFWWDGAKDGWVKYIARGQHLLREGEPVVDVGLFAGDDAPSGCPDVRGDERDRRYAPSGMNFVCVSADVLANRATYADGLVKLPRGRNLRTLRLEKAAPMRLATLESLGRAAAAGVIIAGPKPSRLAGAFPGSADQSRFDALVAQVWSAPTTFADADWSRIQAATGWRADLAIAQAPHRLFTHRRLADADIYFVANGAAAAEKLTLTPRAMRAHVEKWDLDSGRRQRLDRQPDGSIALTLDPLESAFVVLRDSIDTAAETAPTTKQVIAIPNSWSISYKGPKAPAAQGNAPLGDWSKSTDAALRTFSGIATYSTQFTAPRDINKRNRVMLDLGAVGVSATVTLNGQRVGTAWLAPYRIDVTDHVKPGRNTLSVDVASLWLNRLTADAALTDQSGYTPSTSKGDGVMMPQWYRTNQPMPAGPRVAFTTFGQPEADAALVPSGLMGPVTLEAQD